MAYRLAFASTDGKVINQHFGRAEVFYIGEIVEGGTYKYLEARKCEAVCQGKEHETKALYNIATKLSDCRYVLVSQIGPSAEYVLNESGITVLTIRDYIDHALTKLIKYDKEINSSFLQK